MMDVRNQAALARRARKMQDLLLLGMNDGAESRNGEVG